MTTPESTQPAQRALGAAPDIFQDLGPAAIAGLILRHFGSRLADQAKVVAPLVAWLMLFQWGVLGQPVADLPGIAAGLLAVVFGLMLFLEGLRIGLMPFGETLGRLLPVRVTLAVVGGIALVLGMGVTFAEPAIAALRAAGELVDVERTPYLHALLTMWTLPLVLAVGIGVGLAAVLGVLRLIYGWSLKPLIYCTLAPTLGLSVAFALDADLEQILGLAWDCGAVTTGPVTVPLVLALGIGVARSVGAGDNPLAGFGIVTLASLLPILAVLLIGALAVLVLDPAAIQAAAGTEAVARTQSWFERTPWAETIEAIRAVVPLVLFLLAVLWCVLGGRVERGLETGYGIGLCLLGMALFKIGLSTGLAPLGEQTGSLLPLALQAPGDGAEAGFGPVVGVVVVIAFGALLGIGATMAEPALNALGATVEELTDGAFRKETLRLAVALGVGCGIAAGVVKLLFAVGVVWLLLPAYLVAVALTRVSREAYVNVAWDSAGVTTGPVTVPLVMAMGLGLGGAAGALQGFGVLALASVGPIISVLVAGLWADRQTWRRRELSHE